MRKACLLPFVLFSQFILAQPQEKPKELKEVVVEKEKKTFTTKNGNIKVDVANSIYNSVPNTLDLLSKLPKVIVSPDKQSISVVGKGSPLLYIDNQRVEINDFNSLSVDDIKTIEIIQNPSAKYEAEGRAVILITLKFSKRQGYKVVVSETANFQKYFNNYSGINANFKTGKVEFKSNFNYNQLTAWESNGNNFTMTDYGIQSNYLATAVTKRPAFLYGGSIFYKINDEDYLSFTLNRRSRKDIFDVTTHTLNQEGNQVDDVNTLSKNDENQGFTNSFLNYNRKIKKLDANLFTGFQYSKFNQQMVSRISNSYNDGGFEQSQLRNQKFGISVFSGRVDLEKKFKGEMKVELGGLFIGANALTDFEIENVNPPTINDSKYNYKEKNIAAYTQFSGSYKKFSFSGGLRAENTIVKGKYDTEADFSVNKNYINLFPKARLEFTIDSTNSISVNYAKSISRPNFSSTSQVSVYINPYFVWANNINLDPTITDEISIGYQYKDKTLRIAYFKISNPVYFGASFDASQNLNTFMSTNFDKETNFNIDLTLPFKYKFWTTTNVLNLSVNKVEDDLAVMGKVKPNLYYYSNHNFSLPKKIELEITGWGLTRQKLGVFEKNALFTMNAAVSKTFFESLDCTLSWNDIFRKMTFRESFSFNNVSAKGVYYTDSHIVSLSLKYSFGRIKNEEFKEKTIDENSGRIR
ncbi:TonB-dependent receptor domain-containing protein [Flavobacterium sp.]